MDGRRFLGGRSGAAKRNRKVVLKLINPFRYEGRVPFSFDPAVDVPKFKLFFVVIRLVNSVTNELGKEREGQNQSDVVEKSANFLNYFFCSRYRTPSSVLYVVI